MKTIAIMTMAFLPATFFAAFFSMPSRQGDASWIYWVYAMPATAMVFVLWLGFSERRLVKVLQTRVDRVSEMMAPKTEAARAMFSSREDAARSETGGDEPRRSQGESFVLGAK